MQQIIEWLKIEEYATNYGMIEDFRNEMVNLKHDVPFDSEVLRREITRLWNGRRFKRKNKRNGKRRRR